MNELRIKDDEDRKGWILYFRARWDNHEWCEEVDNDMTELGLSLDEILDTTKTH